MHVGERIRELRTKAKLTQSELGKLINMNYIQIGRYETKKANPSFEVLQKIAEGLKTTADYLMNGATDEIASSQLQDKELLNLFKSVEKLSDDDKKMIITFLDAFVTKRKIQSLA